MTLSTLKAELSGELFFDDLIKAIYATDASVYRRLPQAVAYPKNANDIKKLIAFAKETGTTLIPRTAGTSLAGQCVGDGIVVDVSKHFTKIISVNEKEKTVTVQPGVVRDELNLFLKSYGLFFSPDTSTSNRCMIGGMVGNNSSGTTSIQFGVTRDKVLELKTILSNGDDAIFGELTAREFKEKQALKSLEGTIYKTIYKELSGEAVQKQIHDNFPKPEIHRRNTGYALDMLIDSEVFEASNEPFNFCKLLSGSEGTLAFTTEITLKLDVLPPSERIMVAAHFKSIEDSLTAVTTCMKHHLYMCEMMDKTILDCTKNNLKQQENRQFIVDDPEAILMCELKANNREDVLEAANRLMGDLTKEGLSYANVILFDEDIDKAIELRKAGLGLLGNIIGDTKSAACIEDTAVTLPDFANYINDFTAIMDGYNQKAIYYAHAGAGELHLRPVLNLKVSEDVKLFRKITTDVAHLVKKYGGSMSGEHGDGIVRAEFIPLIIGEENYNIVKRIKTVFDPENIFNQGKIVDAFPMDEALRYETDRKEPEIETLLDFSHSEGILRQAEKCNGSGDCRKSPEMGGTMCPSYRATLNEKDSTRARANALREFLTNTEAGKNPFNHEELKEVLDLCLSCKACLNECPSTVDISVMKAEFLYQYQKENGTDLRTKLFAYNNRVNQYASRLPSLTNFFFKNKFTSGLIKKTLGIAADRSMPLLASKSLNNHIKNLEPASSTKKYIKTVYLFVDEFTNFLESSIGVDAIALLEALNYKVQFVKHDESGRAFISKGFLDQAKQCAINNVAAFKDLISEETPLLGVEPSAIYTFKDEYLMLANDVESAKKIAKHTYIIEDFLLQELEKGHFSVKQFKSDSKTVKIHSHCHQKALSNQLSTFKLLNLPVNYKATIIPSGCCGMAGSFGFEKEHYEVSMNVAEQTLLPAVRKASADTIIAANGTSCRHQIKDGAQREAKHPITILKEALI
ncbi:FAD-linked oxidase C-terminal domain-containing protein [Tamlana sp. 2_MG-2023]|uniref:FAD-binding and (Fe-S)-binding domain-containing protein n=1 Tax=unclassified Tamlana TaxID=2614803 RepID=UPI0026E29353|nr:MULTISPECIES: FAD-binding and (Fe-S)-binding domain-containing protein [unclassified Tamlana]MDO6759319.1 FAD-linked oxidase C-terminal domain-containing protein [Tamlana sp. 2_MG-2023]MDO6790542.1 FAD-linked oxidase C-terminal domain-containing protein [Tamlana sp. 1_MG-2023]